MENSPMNLREVWREGPHDTSSILSITEQGRVAITVGGHTFALTLAEWHNLARKNLNGGSE